LSGFQLLGPPAETALWGRFEVSVRGRGFLMRRAGGGGQAISDSRSGDSTPPGSSEGFVSRRIANVPRADVGEKRPALK
jgi:hypothetical protein